jgi:hypothetical protein
MESITQFEGLTCWPELPNSRVSWVYPSNLILFFSFWSFNFFNCFFLFHFYSILDWLRNRFHDLFFSTFYRIITISKKKYLFLSWYSILKTFNVIIKLNKNNLQQYIVIKSIKIHNPGCRVTGVNLIWHRLNIKNWLP